jgi:DNA polymerase-3 subunit epsilon
MRELVFDTETTGLDPKSGDRLVEIGLIELINHIPTGRSFHRYINPERAMAAEALRIHGLDDTFLSDKPLFSAVAVELVEFLGDATLIAHNSTFDMGFLNFELGRCGHPAVPDDRVIDSLMLARRRHPAGPNSLDALCSRYRIDLGRRTYHGALLDAELLAEVYIELIGGRQAALLLGEEPAAPTLASGRTFVPIAARPEPRVFNIDAEVLDAHRAFIGKMGEKAIWNSYFAAEAVTELAG